MVVPSSLNSIAKPINYTSKLLNFRYCCHSFRNLHTNTSFSKAIYNSLLNCITTRIPKSFFLIILFTKHLHAYVFKRKIISYFFTKKKRIFFSKNSYESVTVIIAIVFVVIYFRHIVVAFARHDIY